MLIQSKKYLNPNVNINSTYGFTRPTCDLLTHWLKKKKPNKQTSNPDFSNGRRSEAASTSRESTYPVKQSREGSQCYLHLTDEKLRRLLKGLSWAEREPYTGKARHSKNGRSANPKANKPSLGAIIKGPVATSKRRMATADHALLKHQEDHMSDRALNDNTPSQGQSQLYRLPK